MAYSTRKLHVSELFSLIALWVLTNVKGSKVILLAWFVDSDILILYRVTLGWPDGLVLPLVAKQGFVACPISCLQQSQLVFTQPVVHLSVPWLVLKFLHLRTPQLYLLLFRIPTIRHAIDIGVLEPLAEFFYLWNVDIFIIQHCFYWVFHVSAY